MHVNSACEQGCGRVGTINVRPVEVRSITSIGVRAVNMHAFIL